MKATQHKRYQSTNEVGGKRNYSQVLEIKAAESEAIIKSKFLEQIFLNYSNYYHLNLLIMTEIQTT
jgi:hypothetical protein